LIYDGSLVYCGKQNSSVSGIGERVVDLITLRSHFLICSLAAEGTPKVVSLAYAS